MSASPDPDVLASKLAACANAESGAIFFGENDAGAADQRPVRVAAFVAVPPACGHSRCGGSATSMSCRPVRLSLQPPGASGWRKRRRALPSASSSTVAHTRAATASSNWTPWNCAWSGLGRVALTLAADAVTFKSCRLIDPLLPARAPCGAGGSKEDQTMKTALDVLAPPFPCPYPPPPPRISGSNSAGFPTRPAPAPWRPS